MSTTARAKTNFPVKPLVAAVALALAAVNAYADPTPNQLPGAGRVTAVAVGTTVVNGKNYTVAGGGGVGTTIVDGTNAILGARLDLDSAGTIARAVITWGGPNGAPAGLDTINPAGFNIGSNGLLTFSSTAAVTSAAVLNIDASGNPSQIFGRLNAGTGGGGVAPAIFVSNANGIIVSASGQIAAPSGVGLIAADMSSTTTQYEFVGNNNIITTAPPTLGASYIDVSGAQSKVIIDGAINGSLITNTPAQYVLLVGGDVINTGNIFGTEVDVAVGMQAHVSSHTVNGVAGVSVNRLWYTGDSTSPASLVTGDLWTPGCGDCIDIGTLAAPATGSFINTGSISAVDNWIGVSAANNIRSGTLDDPSLDRLLTGLFADAGIVLNTYNAAGKTELYNVVTGYSTGKTLPFLHVNQSLGADGDVTIKALTRASEPSSITTTGKVLIDGQNIVINSTINHKLSSDGGVNNADLRITSAKSVTITADIGAGDDVEITNTGSGGTGINISGNVISDTWDKGRGDGGIFVTNEGSGSPTVISGNMTSYGYDGWGGVYVDVDGALTMTGNVTAVGDNITITNNADNAVSTIGGAAHAKLIEADRSIVMNFQGPTTISSDVTSDNSYIEITNRRSPSTANAPTTITGDLWARGDGDCSSCDSGAGYIYVTAQGPLTISGTMTSDFDYVHVDNYGLSAGNVTDISGAVSAGTDIFIHNFGAPNSLLDISGQLDAGYDVKIESDGNLQLGTVNAGEDVKIEVFGNSSQLNGPITAGVDEMALWGNVYYDAESATTKVLPAAVITGWTVDLDVLNFQGVNALGTRYATEATKPDAQIVADRLRIDALGSVNAPLVTTNTDWLKNSLWTTSRTPGVFVDATVTANGAGFQAINLGFRGDVNIDSGHTVTPFMNVGLTTGTEPSGGLQGNGGSSMIIQSKGNMDVWGGHVMQSSGPDLYYFQFPGGVVFEAGGDLTVHDPVYNAWTTAAIPFQGVFLEATGLINSLSYFATNGNSLVNYSKTPTTPPGRVYQITQPTPATFNFVNTLPNQAYLNSYKAELAGTPPNLCPISICP